MAIANYVPYEGDLSTGYVVNPSDWNGMFDGLTNYINSVLVPAIQAVQGAVSGVPTGFMGQWFPTGAVPAGWALCNGQTINWLTGPLAGNALTTPNYIGMLPIGSDIPSGSSTPNSGGYGATTSGSTVGSAGAHSHTTSTGNTGAAVGSSFPAAGGGGGTAMEANHVHAIPAGTTNAVTTQPPALGYPVIIKL